MTNSKFATLKLKRYIRKANLIRIALENIQLLRLKRGIESDFNQAYSAMSDPLRDEVLAGDFKLLIDSTHLSQSEKLPQGSLVALAKEFIYKKRWANEAESELSKMFENLSQSIRDKSGFNSFDEFLNFLYTRFVKYAQASALKFHIHYNENAAANIFKVWRLYNTKALNTFKNNIFDNQENKNLTNNEQNAIVK